MRVREFKYQFAAGPFDTEKELRGEWQTGNCRRAAQWYLFAHRGIFLPPDKVLLPDAYNTTGNFVYKNRPIDFARLQHADIIYAEKIRDKKGNLLARDGTPVASEQHIRNLHTALWNGEPAKEIWHATAIEGASCFWPLERFLHFYKPIAVKRIQAI